MSENGEDRPLLSLSASVARLTDDPILREYARHIEKAQTFRLTEPWQALGEVRFWALFLDTTPRLWTFLGYVGSKEEERQAILDEAETLRAAQPYLISKRICDVIEASPLPAHVVGRESISQPLMAICMADTWEWHGPDGGRAKLMLMVLGETTEGIEIDYILSLDHPSHRDRPLAVACEVIPYGSRWPDDYEPADAAGRAVIEFTLKFLAFINSPYAELQKRGMPRQQRRAIARKYSAAPSRDQKVTVVVLRRPESSGSRRPGEKGYVDWACQWWVGGHFRNQWYASEEIHKLIWIRPYLKGPEGKPLKEKVYAVVR